MLPVITIDFLPQGSKEKRYLNQANYLVGPKSVLARSGILQYSAAAMGIREGDPARLVNVYRSPQEVSKIKEHYANLPLTLNHPHALEVTPLTAKGLTVGTSGSVVELRNIKDGQVEVVSDIVITDKESITEAQKGNHEELSVGYYSTYMKQSGKAPDGTPYEYIQVNLVPNHVALVEEGRCGSMCKVADEKNKTNKEQPMKVTIDGKEHTVDEAVVKSILQLVVDGEMPEALKEAIEKKKKGADMHEDDDMKKKAADKEDEEEEAKKKAADKEDEEEKKAADDKIKGYKAADTMFSIELPDGTKATVDRAALVHIQTLQNGTKAKTADTKAVDSMAVYKLANNAGKIIPNFDVNAFSGPDQIKAAIIQQVLPTVDSAQLNNATVLETLYSTACDMFEKNSATYQSDIVKLTGGKGLQITADGANGQASPVAALLGQVGGMTQATVDSNSNDPFNTSGLKLQFNTDKKGE